MLWHNNCDRQHDCLIILGPFCSQNMNFIGTVGSLRGGGVGSISTSFRSSIAAYTGSAKTFSMNDIVKATDSFHASRIIGEGGFGCVYSGTLEDGLKVAVKVLKREDHHGDREFLAEVEMLSRLHHRNLVKLIGICAEDSLRCLVYELIPNGSVESHLHGTSICLICLLHQFILKVSCQLFSFSR